MSLRKRIAAVLRRVDANDLIEWFEARAFDVEAGAQRLARTIDPPSPWGPGWTEIGFTTDDIEAFSREVLEPQREALVERLARLTEAHSPAWREVMERARPSFFLTPEGDLFPGRPTTMDPEIIAKVGEAMARPAPFDPNRVRYPVDFQVPTPLLDDAIDHSKFVAFDMAPHIEEFDAHVRDITRAMHAQAEAVVADWLDEVGEVAPGFGAETVREILRERES